VTSSAFALAGWASAFAALAAAALTRRALAKWLEAVAEACHELRGPLAAVSLGVELGSRNGMYSIARMRAIELELGRAARALEDLEGRRVGGSRPGAREQVDVGALLADSVEAWRPGAAARGVELRAEWSGPNGIVRGDRLRLAQATGNLIANAIEHGGGDVDVRGRTGPDGVRIEVRDRGPGLSDPLAALIRRSDSTRCGRFGRHARARAARSSRGFGLGIANSIAIAHGGRLASAPSERGARLVLELPADGPERSVRSQRG
jgi:signal transduction histidine kinase